LLRPNTYFSVFLQMEQGLESVVRCLVFTLWVNTLYWKTSIWKRQLYRQEN